MERYDNLELDLECDGGGGGGGVAQRASLFGGMFKKSTKSNTEHGLSVHSQDNLSMNTELLNGNDSLTDDNNYKDKSGGFKDMFKKSKSSKDMAQTSLSVTSPELSNSTDSLTETKSPKDKAGALGAPPRLPPRPEHLGRASQDNLYFDPNSNSDNQTENTVTKESSGVFGMFKKSPKPTRSPSQDNMSNSSEGSQDSLTVHSTKGGGVFGGMFKKSPKIFTRTQSQDDLSDPTEFSQSENTKEKGGLFRGVFKKPKGAKTHSQEDLTGELSGSKEELSDNNSTKGNEKSGLLSGVFKKPKLGARSQSKDDLTADDESSDQQENLTENNTKEKSGILSGVFKKPKLAKSQSKDDLTADGELSNSQENLTENITKEKSGILSGVFKKPKFAKSQSKDDLTADGELTNSQENLADNNAKEKSGIFFKKPKFARSQSKDDLNADAELSNSQENLTENNTKEKSVFFGGMFKKQKGLGSKSQSQDDLSENTEHSGSSENLAEKPSKGGVSNFLKNPFTSSAQKEDKVPKSATSSEKTKAKWEKGSDSDSEENGETQHSAKHSKFAGAMTKLNPFRSGHKYEKSLDLSDEEEKEEIDKPKEQKQKDTEEKQEMAQSNEKQKEAKPKTVKNLVMEFEPRDRSEAILVTQAKDEVNKEMVSKEKRQTAETPRVPPRHTQQEMDKVKEPSQNPEETVAKHGGLYPTLPNKPDDETLSAEKPTEDNEGEKKPVKVRRTKHHNPFMPRTGVKLAAVETAEEAKEEENVETSTQEEENKDEEGTPKAEEKAKKPKRRNPFMPQVKNKVGQRRGAEEGENEGANRSLFDQLEEFRFEPSAPESSEDADNLMEWWNTVENWEDTPQNEDMTPKEEAKAFAVTADKIQKGIRVFNKLFSERAESLWQHVIDLNGISDGLDKFNKKTKIAQITGGSTSATGGVLTIAGLALAPITMGTSLIVTAVGLGVATAGGLTSAGAGISNQVNNSMDRKKVEKIVEDYQEKMVDLNKALIFIKQGIEHLRRFDLIKIKKQAYNRDFPVLNSRFYEDGAMAGKAILINANEIMRVVQIANVAGSTAARAVQIASMATGVLTGLFVGMDIYFVAKDSKELKKGAKSEFAAKIREVAQQLHDGLVELNTIREELQSTSAPQNEEEGGGEGEEKEKKKDEYDDDEEEDEIDRIKKQIKKDYENREWV